MIAEKTFTIPQGATESDVIDLNNRSLVGFEFPTMTGTTLTLKCGRGTPVSLGDESAAFSIASPSARSVRLSQILMGIRFLQLISGSAEAAARSIIVLTDDYQK